MVNLITEKTLNPNSSVKNVTTSSDAKKTSKSPAIFRDESLSVKNLAPAVVMLGAGGVLLYLGLRTPAEVKFFKKDVQNRMKGLEEVVKKYAVSVSNIVDDAFGGVQRYISDYSKSQKVRPFASVKNIKSKTNPREILDFQNSVFNELRISGESIKPGASYIDEFGLRVIRAKSVLADKLGGKRHKLNQEMEDLAKVLPFRNGKHSEILETEKYKLEGLVSRYGQMLDDVEARYINDEINSLYPNMADRISAVREARTEIKGEILDIAFARFREILGLGEDFQPSYDKIPTLSRFSKLSKEELAPTSLPESIKKDYADSVYVRFVESVDFSKLKKKDLVRLFAGISYDDSLKDLSFLIDRMRLEEAVFKGSEVGVLSGVIAKLEYLSNKLQTIGHEELTKICGREFDGTLSEKNRANLASVYSVARRCGYETLEDLFKNFITDNPKLENCDIKKYFDVIKNNPQIYFF